MSWEAQAACGSARFLRLFFGADDEAQAERELRETRAKSVCGACQVRSQCLDAALHLAVRHGIWGGLTESERVRERRRRMRLRALREPSHVGRL